MATVTALSDHLRQSVARERELVIRRLAELQDQAARVRSVADSLEADVVETARLLRNMDEMLGLAPQLSLDAHGELRGQNLQEIAVELLRQKKGIGIEVHYKDWYALLLEAGLIVGGKDPLATFLTQIGRAPDVESVRPRSGLYRLRSV